MGAIKLKGIPHEGKLTLVVPDELNEKTVEVTIESTNEGYEKENLSERTARLLDIIGIAKFPETPITKYDVYEQ